MRFGIALYNFGYDLVDEFADMGYDAVSIEVYAGLFDRLAGEFADRARARDLQVTVHGRVNHNNMGLIREMADRLEGRLVSVLPDVNARRTEQGVELLLGEFLAFREFFEERGIWFGFEDLPLTRADLDAHFDEKVRSSPRFGLLLDVGHLNIRLRSGPARGGGSIAEALAGIPVPIRELHVHDNDGRRDQHAHIGYGNNRFEETAAGLRKLGFDGVSTIEIDPRISGLGVDECKRGARESLRIWRGLLEGPRPPA